MSEKTMLDLGGLAFLEGDPLGLRDLEESLMWKANGPLPDWLDGAEPPDDEVESIPTSVSFPGETPTSPAHEEPYRAAVESIFSNEPASESPAPTAEIRDEPERAETNSIFSNEAPAESDLPATMVIVSSQESIPAAPSLATPSVEQPTVETPVLVAPFAAELIDAAPAEAVSEGLVSINDILRFVDEAPTPAPQIADVPPPTLQAPPVPVVAVPARRFLSFDELIEARLCLLTSVGDRLWAIPLDRVTIVGRPPGAGAVDLFERQEGRKRGRAGIAIGFDSDAVVIVDQIHGPRSFGWDHVAPGCDAPDWMLAQSSVAGQRVGLLDWESLPS